MSCVVKNANDLRKLNYGDIPKIILPIADINVNQQQIECSQILRLLPKKRLTAVTNFNNEEVIIKMFFSPLKARIAFLRECNVYQKLEKFSILTPKVLLYGKIGTIFNAVYFFILQKLNCDFNEQNCDYALNVVSVLANMHKSNIYANDPHLGNFIKTKNGVYIIDASNIFFKKNRTLLMKVGIKNLVKFIAYINPYDRQYANMMRDSYMLHANNNGNKNYFKFFNAYYGKFCNYLKNKKVKKIFRSSTNMVAKNFYNRKFIYQRKYDNNEFKNLLNNIDGFIAAGEILKSGRTTTVAKINFDNNIFVVKRYNNRNFFHCLKKIFKRSRAATCWTNAHTLLFFNIKTPNPIAIIEKKFFYLKYKSYYLTEFILAPTLDVFLKTEIDYNIKLATAKKAIKILFRLKELHIKHGDMKANNFLIYNNDIYLIDLDSMRAQKKFFYNLSNRFVKDKARLLKNWQDDIDTQNLFVSIHDPIENPQ